MKRLGILGFVALALVAVAGCAVEGRSMRYPGAGDPPCMPDGSVVWLQYSDLEGSFKGAKASVTLCPWRIGKG